MAFRANGSYPSTVTKWCRDTSQPGIVSLLKIANLLEVDIKELIAQEYKSYILSENRNHKKQRQGRVTYTLFWTVPL